MYCITCGNKMECEFKTLDEYGRLELYHCFECDTLHLLRDETVSYIKNATTSLIELMEDLSKNNYKL